MMNREMKLAIGEELQTPFHQIVSATKQVAENTAEELVPMKKALEDIDGALKTEHRTIPPPSSPQKDLTFGIHATGDGQYGMGNSIVHIEGNTLKVDGKDYELTPGLGMLILYKKLRHQHYSSDDYSVYKAQTRVRAYPDKHTCSARLRSTWKWKHMLSGVVIPGDVVVEEDEESTEGSVQTVIGHRHHRLKNTCSSLSPHPLLPQEKLERRERPGNRSIKGME